jgi:carbon storage regulator
MLMISRRLGERIVVGDCVEVTVTEIHKSSVRLAIKSAPGTLVLRGEVFDEIQGANARAAQAPLDDKALQTLEQFEPENGGSSPQTAPLVEPHTSGAFAPSRGTALAEGRDQEEPTCR